MPKQHRRNQSSGQFYFVTHNPGHSESVREAGDDVAVIEPKLSGAAEEEFKPKPVNRNLVKGMSMMRQSERSHPKSPSRAPSQPNPLSRTLFSLFGGNKPVKFDEEGAKKASPKVFFANERTFLKWMNVSVWVAGISIGLSTIQGSSPDMVEALSSLAFLGIAIVIVCYSMFQYARRSLMVVKRSPGPYEDRWGPVVIGSLFVVSFTAQYCIYLANMASRR